MGIVVHFKQKVNHFLEKVIQFKHKVNHFKGKVI